MPLVISAAQSTVMTNLGARGLRGRWGGFSRASAAGRGRGRDMNHRGDQCGPGGAARLGVPVGPDVLIVHARQSRWQSCAAERWLVNERTPALPQGSWIATNCSAGARPRLEPRLLRVGVAHVAGFFRHCFRVRRLRRVVGVTRLAGAGTSQGTGACQQDQNSSQSIPPHERHSSRGWLRSDSGYSESYQSPRASFPLVEPAPIQMPWSMFSETNFTEPSPSRQCTPPTW